MLPVLLYGAEGWILLNTNVAALRIFERKVLRKIYSPVRVDDDFRIRSNSVLYELLNDMDVVGCINIQRLCWLSKVVRMEEDAPARHILTSGFSRSHNMLVTTLFAKGAREDIRFQSLDLLISTYIL